MEGVKSALLPRIQCPRFNAVEQRAEHTGLVHLHLGADGQHGVIPYSGTMVREIFYHFEDAVVHGDAWSAADILTQDFGLFEVDGQTKLLASAK